MKDSYIAFHAIKNSFIYLHKEEPSLFTEENEEELAHRMFERVVSGGYEMTEAAQSMAVDLLGYWTNMVVTSDEYERNQQEYTERLNEIRELLDDAGI